MTEFAFETLSPDDQKVLIAARIRAAEQNIMRLQLEMEAPVGEDVDPSDPEWRAGLERRRDDLIASVERLRERRDNLDRGGK